MLKSGQEVKLIHARIHAVGYENILDILNVGHCGIKVKVTLHFTLFP